MFKPVVQVSSTASRFGTAAMASAGAIALVRWVTMRTVYVEYDVPSYGFPLPAFGWTGVSSGVWWCALLPLSVDVCVALLVAAPVAVAAGRWLPARVVSVLGGAASLGMTVVLLPALAKVAMGHLHVSLLDFRQDWPVECRSVWLGEADGLVRYDDPNDSCAATRLRGL